MKRLHSVGLRAVVLVSEETTKGHAAHAAAKKLLYVGLLTSAPSSVPHWYASGAVAPIWRIGKRTASLGHAI